MKKAYRYIIAISAIILLNPIRQTAGAEENLYLRIVSYNVENLFDIKDDPEKNDDDYTPEGAQHWTFYRYKNKLSQIAQVVSAIGEWQAPALVGLIEVETDSCLYELTRWHLKRRFYPYKYVLEEGPDERGIDPGLLYDSTMLQLIHKESIRVDLQNSEQHTRDILYCCFATIRDNHYEQDTLHVFVCHFPSQRGGTAETQDKRDKARATLQARTDSILDADPEALIIAMGDFNSEPKDNIPQLKNLMTEYAGKNEGTHKYQGRWTCLDQFYASSALLKRLGKPMIFAPDWLLEEDTRYMGKKPKRTYVGPRYLGGYSDHLPIYVDFNL